MSSRNGYSRFLNSSLIKTVHSIVHVCFLIVVLLLSLPLLLIFVSSSFISSTSTWYQSQRRDKVLTMAASSSEIAKSEESKAITIAPDGGPHSIGLHVPIKLMRENFLLWKTQIFPLLNYHDLAHILTQDPPISSQLDNQGRITINPAYQVWWRQDQHVLSLIVTSLSESVLSCVVGKNTAKEAWSALSKHCSSTNPSRIMHLHNRLHNTSKGTRSIADFVQDIQRTCDELGAAGHLVQETVAIYALLRGLGSSYSAFCAGISSNLSHLCLDDVIAQISSYEELMKFSTLTKDSTNTEFPPAANQAQFTSSDCGKGRNNNRNGRGRGRNGGRYTPRCQLYGQYGHRVLECRERFHRMFHGHQNSPTVQSPQLGPQAYNLSFTQSPISQDHASWYPDSGATHHVTNDGQSLIDPAVYQGPDQLQIANGSGLKIHSIGSSSLISRSQPLKLVNILHVPEIRKKLLSVYRLTNDNVVFVEFHANYCVVKEEETGKQLLRGTVKDGLYLLSQAHQPKVNIGEKTNLNIWHQRLGHPNMRTFQSIISKYGLPTSSVNKSLSCDACMSSKSHRLPYSNSLHQMSKPLEVIHSDLWDEAVCTTVYLINRLPTQNLKNCSPYRLIYRQEPDYSLLKSFECTCYPCLRPYATSKLDARSEKCIFISYSAYHLGYRCLSLTNGKIYISRDVTFMEDHYPYKEHTSISNSNTQNTSGLLRCTS